MSELLYFILDHEPPFQSQSRLSSLYSDFLPLKTTNPDGYQANISAWTTALTHASRAGLAPGSGSLSLRCGDALAMELETKRWGRPLGLGCVVEEGVASRFMIPLREFMEAKTGIYERRWINIQVPSPWQVAKWGLRQVGLGGSDRLAEGEFVVVANVEVAAKQLQTLLTTTNPTSTSLLYTLPTFTTTFSTLLSQTHPLTPTDISILLRHLTRDLHLATTATSPNGTLTIKLRAPHSSDPPSPIAATDHTIAHLNTLSTSLTAQTTALNERITSLTTLARNALSHDKTNRTLALSYLRQKKQAETTLSRRAAALDQVTDVLLSIDEAAGQVEMVKAMEAGGEVLRELNRKVGGVERVEGVMEGLREEMEGVQEVGRVFAETGHEGVDDEEVEGEMEVLLREEEMRREKERVLREREEEERRKREEEVLASMPKVPEELKNTDGHMDVEQDVAQEKKEKDLEKRLSVMSLDEPPPPHREQQVPEAEMS